MNFSPPYPPRRTHLLCATLMTALFLISGCKEPPGSVPERYPSEESIGGLLQTDTLHSSNSLAYGLAYEPSRDGTVSRLHVSDFNDDEIYIYQIDPSGLSLSERMSTSALDPAFVEPRGLAYGYRRGRSYLYALTSQDTDGDGTYDSTLWRVDLDASPRSVHSIDLDRSCFEISGLEVFGLTLQNDFLYVSYNSSSFPTAQEQVRRGILRLRLGRSIAVKSISNLHSPRPKISFEKKRRHNGSIPESNPSDSFTLFPTVKHLPNSGREVSSGAYSRAPAFGLASMEFGSTEYLWATSYNKYLYLAHAPDGRGLFHFDSPGKKKIYGLACGDGVLWAVDRVSGPDQIHRIRITENLDTPQQWNRKVRHIQVTKSSTSKNSRDRAGLTQNLALVHPRTKRPGQNYDLFSLSRSSHPCASITYQHYDPAGDSSSRQIVVQSRYDGPISGGETITSTYDVDVVTSNFRHFVYPHRCDTSGSTEPDYLDDCSTIYRMSDTTAYAEFLDRIEEAMEEEYGSSALSTNPYWRARNILEFITEHYEYGNVSDTSSGHYAYHPSNLKMELLWDATSGNEKMSCSTSTFTLVGLCRSLGVPARWVGTSRFRSNYEDASGTEVSYDTNGDTFLGVAESSKDKPFHRWAEVWMGNAYGWQRFDPTPKSDGPRELSQYELMWKATRGVNDTDLVLTVGSGREEPFFNNRRNMQYYNAGANYDHPDDWSTDTKYVTWSNACFVEITSVSATGAGHHTLSWNLTGRWELDSSATLTLRIQPMVADGSSWVRDGSSTTLQTGLAAVSGSATLDLSGMDPGTYRLEVVKSDDSRTGAASSILTLP